MCEVTQGQALSLDSPFLEIPLLIPDGSQSPCGERC